MCNWHAYWKRTMKKSVLKSERQERWPHFQHYLKPNCTAMVLPFQLYFLTEGNSHENRKKPLLDQAKVLASPALSQEEQARCLWKPHKQGLKTSILPFFWLLDAITRYNALKHGYSIYLSWSTATDRPPPPMNLCHAL